MKSKKADYAFLIFSSILKIDFGEPINKRLKDLPKHLRSKVLRRNLLRSPAMIKLLKNKTTIDEYIEKRWIRLQILV